MEKKLYGYEIAHTVTRTYGKTQADVAEHLNVTRQTVWNWFNERTAIPVNRVVDIADWLGCSLDELFMRDTPDNGEMPREMSKLNSAGRSFVDAAIKSALSNPDFTRGSADNVSGVTA